MIRQHLIPASAALCLTISLFFGLFVQDAADPRMMAPFALMAGWIVMSGRLLKFSLKDSAFLGLLLLWFFWGLSTLLTDYKFNAKVTWIIMSTLPVSYMFWRLADFSQHWLKILGGMFLLSGIGLAISAVLQVTVYRASAGWGGRAGYPFSDPNMLGIYLSLILLPVLSLIIKPLTPARLRLILGVAVAILIAGLFATQSRSALLGTLAGGGLILLLMRSQIIWTKQKLIGLGAAAVAGIGILFATGLIQRFISIFTAGGDKDVNSRFQLWQTAFEMSMNKPLTGYGFGTFGTYYPIFRPAGENSAGWWVHMDPLQWAVESGWQTPIVFYLFVLYIAFRVWQLVKTRTLTSFQAGCAGGLFCLFLNAHTAYPLHVIPFMLLATGMMVMLIPLTPLASFTKRHYAFASLMLFSLLGIMWMGIKSSLTLYLWEDMNKAKLTGEQTRYISDLQICIERGDPQFAYCKFAVIENYLQGSTVKEETLLKMVAETRATHPFLPQPDFYTGMYYLRAQPPSFARAIESFRQALLKNPTFWPARKNMVNAMHQNGQVFDALTVLEKGSDYPVPTNDLEYYNTTRKKLRETVYGK